MTDHPIPDDLVNKVGTVLALELGHTMLDPMNGVPGPNTARIAREALHALASWADDVGATHIALDGWRRVKADPAPVWLGVGGVHHGHEHTNPTCSCDSVLVPLYTLTPATEEET